MKIREGKREKIEEVREIKYLDFLLQKIGGGEVHIRDRVRRACWLWEKPGASEKDYLKEILEGKPKCLKPGCKRYIIWE